MPGECSLMVLRARSAAPLLQERRSLSFAIPTITSSRHYHSDKESGNTTSSLPTRSPQPSHAPLNGKPPARASKLAHRLQQSLWDLESDMDRADGTHHRLHHPSFERPGSSHGQRRPSQSSPSFPLSSTPRSAGGGVSSSMPLSSPPLPQRQQARHSPNRTVTATLTREGTERSPDPRHSHHRYNTSARSGTAAVLAEALTGSAGDTAMDLEDDDIVLDTPASLLPCMAAAVHDLQLAHPQRHGKNRQRRNSAGSDAAGAEADGDVVTPERFAAAHPAARGVGQDVIDLVTDVFTAQREAEVKRRRELLYELTHPNPIDYTYAGKLVPPPPLSFGQVTEEARSLGNQMMLGQTYSLVRQAGTRAADDDFSTATGVQDSAVARGGGVSSSSISPASVIETAISGPSSSAKQHASPRCRSRARETNAFRDHNYFFEISELYQEIVLVGRACAGKSSLLNSLLGQNVAKTSSTPNTTRKISFYQSVTPEELSAFHAKEHHNQLVKLPGGGLQLTFVDMPGYGIEGMSEQWRDAAIELTDAYFGVRRSVNTVLYCMDCELGLTKTDVKYFEWLENVQGTFFVVLTKCDSVPHSRITSVMRQVYSLITKNRRKYRKVFPFIIPTSAKDGTNVELLRGLITETSGMIPGDKLRDLLKQKKEAFTQTALLAEASRIESVRQMERAQAREFFQLTRGTDTGEGRRKRDCDDDDRQPAEKDASRLPSSAPAPLLRRPDTLQQQQSQGEGGGGSRGHGADAAIIHERAVRHTESGPAAAAVSAPSAQHTGASQRYVLNINKESAAADVDELLFLRGEGGSCGESPLFPSTGDAAAAAAQTRRERRERFLAWRRAHPLEIADQPLYEEPASVTNSVADVEDGEGVSARQAAAAAGGGQGGGRRYRLHTGLDNPQSAQTVLDVPQSVPAQAGVDSPQDDSSRGETAPRSTHHGDSEGVAESTPPLTPLAAAPRSSVIGFTPSPAATPSSSPASAPQAAAQGGAVSRFLDVLEGFGQQPNTIKSAKQRRKEARRMQGRRGGGGRGGLLAEDASGRLAPYRAGKVCGPALVQAEGAAVDKRQAQWRAEQLKTLLMKENPEAPWLAMHQLRRKVQSQQEEAALSGMRRKEAAAYLRDAGRVTSSFDKFEGEVTTAKFMNEVRQAPTLRSQQQMHLNATAKINYRSMPAGLWKRYGEQDKYWPTPRVLGRAEDESHKP